MTKKKIFALVLSVVMLLSSMSVSAFAFTYNDVEVSANGGERAAANLLSQYAGQTQSRSRVEDAIAVGDTGLAHVERGWSQSCPYCYRALITSFSDEYLGVNLYAEDSSIVGNLRITKAMISKNLLTQLGSTESDVPSLAFLYDGLKAGTTVVHVEYYFLLSETAESGSCPYCRRNVSLPSMYGYVKCHDLYTVTVTDTAVVDPDMPERPTDEDVAAQFEADDISVRVNCVDNEGHTSGTVKGPLKDGSYTIGSVVKTPSIVETILRRISLMLAI